MVHEVQVVHIIAIIVIDKIGLKTPAEFGRIFALSSGGLLGAMKGVTGDV